MRYVSRRLMICDVSQTLIQTQITSRIGTNSVRMFDEMLLKNVFKIRRALGPGVLDAR